MSVRILHGDCRSVLPTLPDASVQCCVTSPPYFGLRDYGVDGQIGLEPMPDEYVAQMVAVFRDVRRVLRDDGVLFLNLGDSYAAGKSGRDDMGDADLARRAASYGTGRGEGAGPRGGVVRKAPAGYKPKDLIGIPWLVAFALRADGWYLRSDIIWSKPNPMPESVTDRPTKAHEYVFLLSKSARYFWDAAAVAEPSVIGEGAVRNITPRHKNVASTRNDGDRFGIVNDGTRNARTVWTIATQPFSGSHFATMPPALAERCILAGSKRGDTVLDPFSGAGTTALVADRLQRHAIGIELNPEYAGMGANRVQDDAPLFAQVSA